MGTSAGFRRWLLPALVAVALVAGCGDDKDNTVTLQETVTGSSTEETTGAPSKDVADAQAVLKTIIEKDRTDPEYHTLGFRTDPAISQDLIDKIARIDEEATQSGAPGIDFDPFICAQQIPDGATYTPGDAATQSIAIVGHLKFGPQTEDVVYDMAREGNDWKLASTSCVAEAIG